MPDKHQKSNTMVEKQLPDLEVQVRLATFDQYRGLLFSVAYRMLGSVADAEDMLQETFIRWQRAHEKEIRSPRAFLITIISRLSINHLQSARVQREEYFGEWLPEPIVHTCKSWTPTTPSQRPIRSRTTGIPAWPGVLSSSTSRVLSVTSVEAPPIMPASAIGVSLF